MGRSGHAGRAIKHPATPPGSVIVEHMGAAGLSMQHLAQRLGTSRATVWRLLHGRTGFSNRVTVEGLCQALNLAGAEKERFIVACMPPSHGEQPGDSRQPRRQRRERASREGTHSVGPAPDSFAAFVSAHMRAAGLSCAQLAREVGVAPSTMSRLLRGKIKSTHTMRHQPLARALNLCQADRRTFLELAIRAGIFAMAVHSAPATTRFLALERELGQTLDEIEREVMRLRHRRTQGEVAVVYERARRLFAQLYDQPLPAASMLRSSELTRAKLSVGFEYCEAQAAALPWFERAPDMITTLDRMQCEVLQYVPSAPREFASEYGHLVNLRAPLYRSLHAVERTEEYFRESIWQFTWALEKIMPGHHEVTLHVELLRNRAHTYLLHGDVARWRADLEAAERTSNAIRGVERDTFQALVTYSWGEGYKRLLDAPQLTARQRAGYLREALDALNQGLVVFGQHEQWVGYSLLAQIAEAQCLIWSDPDETVRRGERLRADALRLYPSLVRKIDGAMTVAARQMQRQGRV